MKKSFKNMLPSIPWKIRLYCKGADTILLDRLHHSTQELLNTTTDHLNVGMRKGTLWFCCSQCGEGTGGRLS